MVKAEHDHKDPKTEFTDVPEEVLADGLAANPDANKPSVDLKPDEAGATVIPDTTPEGADAGAAAGATADAGETATIPEEPEEEHEPHEIPPSVVAQLDKLISDPNSITIEELKKLQSRLPTLKENIKNARTIYENDVDTDNDKLIGDATKNIRTLIQAENVATGLIKARELAEAGPEQKLAITMKDLIPSVLAKQEELRGLPKDTLANPALIEGVIAFASRQFAGGEERANQLANSENPDTKALIEVQLIQALNAGVEDAARMRVELFSKKATAPTPKTETTPPPTTGEKKETKEAENITNNEANRGLIATIRENIKNSRVGKFLFSESATNIPADTEFKRLRDKATPAPDAYLLSYVFTNTSENNIDAITKGKSITTEELNQLISILQNPGDEENKKVEQRLSFKLGTVADLNGQLDKVADRVGFTKQEMREATVKKLKQMIEERKATASPTTTPPTTT